MNAHNPFEDSAKYTTRHEAHELVERALRGEHIEIPSHLKDDEDFKGALKAKIASLLYHELDESAERIVENLEIPQSILRSDPVHAAALRELTHLEETPEKNEKDIERLALAFGLRIDEINGLPEYYINRLRPLLPPEDQF